MWRCGCGRVGSVGECIGRQAVVAGWVLGLCLAQLACVADAQTIAEPLVMAHDAGEFGVVDAWAEAAARPAPTLDAGVVDAGADAWLDTGAVVPPIHDAGVSATEASVADAGSDSSSTIDAAPEASSPPQAYVATCVVVGKAYTETCSDPPVFGAPIARIEWIAAGFLSTCPTPFGCDTGAWCRVVFQNGTASTGGTCK